MDNNKCQKGHHYHPTHPKADANGCMKNDDMKEEHVKVIKEQFQFTMLLEVLDNFEVMIRNHTSEFN